MVNNQALITSVTERPVYFFIQKSVLFQNNKVKNEHEWPPQSFRINLIIQNLQTSSIPQTSFLVGTFFATPYSKAALKSDWNHIFIYHF